MKKQAGYYNINFAGLFWIGIILGGLLSIAIWELAGWAWPYIKAFIHGATA
jgi:hypothetical protein